MRHTKPFYVWFPREDDTLCGFPIFHNVTLPSKPIWPPQFDAILFGKVGQERVDVNMLLMADSMAIPTSGFLLANH